MTVLHKYCLKNTKECRDNVCQQHGKPIVVSDKRTGKGGYYVWVVKVKGTIETG